MLVQMIWAILGHIAANPGKEFHKDFLELSLQEEKETGRDAIRPDLRIVLSVVLAKPDVGVG